MKKQRLKREKLHCWWIIFGLNRIINFTQLDLKKDYFESTNGKCFGLPITPWLEIRPSLGKTFLFACENPTIPFRIPSGLKSQYQTRKMILNVRRIKFFFCDRRQFMLLIWKATNFSVKRHFLPINNALKCLQMSTCFLLPFLLPASRNMCIRTIKTHLDNG